MRIVPKILVGLMLCVFVLGLRSPVWGQTGTYTEINPKGKKAESISVSDKTILFEVIMPSGKLIKLRIKEGGMAKFGDLDQGYAFAVVPLIKDLSRQTVSFTVFQLSQDKSGNESIRQLEQLDVDSTTSIFTNAEPKIQLRVISTEEPKAKLFPDSSPKGFSLFPSQPRNWVQQ